jgi:hypothetical protein
MEAARGLKVVKQSQSTFVRTIEAAILLVDAADTINTVRRNNAEPWCVNPPVLHVFNDDVPRRHAAKERTVQPPAVMHRAEGRDGRFGTLA